MWDQVDGGVESRLGHEQMFVTPRKITLMNYEANHLDTFVLRMMTVIVWEKGGSSSVFVYHGNTLIG